MGLSLMIAHRTSQQTGGRIPCSNDDDAHLVILVRAVTKVEASHGHPRPEQLLEDLQHSMNLNTMGLPSRACCIQHSAEHMD